MEKKGKVEQKHEKGRKTDCCHHAGSGNDGVTDTGGMHILQNEVVYAAETENQVWTSGDGESLVFDAGKDDKWTDKAFASNNTEEQPNAVRLENVKVGTTVKVKAKVKVSDATGLDGAENPKGEYNAIQLASAIQSGNGWTYAKSDDYPFLKGEDFKDGEATVTFKYTAEAGALQSVFSSIIHLLILQGRLPFRILKFMT